MTDSKIAYLIRKAFNNDLKPNDIVEIDYFKVSKCYHVYIGDEYLSYEIEPYYTDKYKVRRNIYRHNECNQLYIFDYEDRYIERQ